MTLEQRNWYFNKYWAGDDLNLSDRITAFAVQDQVIEDIRLNLQSGNQLSELVETLSANTTQENIAGTIRDIERQARQVISGDTSEFKQFQSDLKSARREIESSIADNPTKLKKAYLRVVNAAEKLKEDGLDKAIENAVDKKVMYNAYRLALTETNRAYNAGIFTEAKDDPDADAIQLNLSYGRNNCDICQELAEQDNGAGPGIYAFEDCPATPIHPNCNCILTPVYRLPEGMTADDLDSGRGDYEKMEEISD